MLRLCFGVCEFGVKNSHTLKVLLHYLAKHKRPKLAKFGVVMVIKCSSYNNTVQRKFAMKTHRTVVHELGQNVNQRDR